LGRQIIVHSEKCTGCKICELVCSSKKEGRYNPALSRVRILSTYPEDGADKPTVCVQCMQALCSTCGRDAMHREKDTRAILIDDEKCNGCDKCTISCPLGAIKLLRARPLVIVCDLCEGGPACVKNCPTGAIEYSDPMQARIRPQTDVLRRCLTISIEKNPWRTGI
jgi:carbon-monoxide dehydrogenase iron sulfur subunit